VNRSDLIDLIVRAAAALETPSDLSNRELVDIIEDLRGAEDKLKAIEEREQRVSGGLADWKQKVEDELSTWRQSPILLTNTKNPQVEDFEIFMRGHEGPNSPGLLRTTIGAIRSVDPANVEPSALIGVCYIQGVLHHAHFVRVKYEDGPDHITEDGDGVQVPWNDDEESTCSQWWQDLERIDEIVFDHMEITGFPGKWVLYVTPGER